MLIPPPGILRPNRAAIEAGLSFAQAFQNGPAAPFLARGGLADGTLALSGGGTIGVLHGGHGLTTSGGYWGSNSTSNTYSLDTTSGTVIVAFVPDHNSGSAGNRIMLYWGNTAFPASAAIAMSNFFGNWTAGWADGADKRVSVSATGLYSAGEVLTTGLTWDATAQRVYMRGVEIGNGAAATYASTAGSDFLIGIYSTFPWISSSTGGILYALAFDRALTAAEMLAAERDMWWWVERRQGLRLRRPLATPHTATPGAASLAWQGHAPTVEAGATVALGAGALAWQGHAPAVTAGVTATPGAGVLAWQGLAPTVNRVLPAAPASRTVTWPAQGRLVAWSATERRVTWAETDRTVTWRGD